MVWVAFSSGCVLAWLAGTASNVIGHVRLVTRVRSARRDNLEFHTCTRCIAVQAPSCSLPCGRPLTCGRHFWFAFAHSFVSLPPHSFAARSIILDKRLRELNYRPRLGERAVARSTRAIGQHWSKQNLPLNFVSPSVVPITSDHNYELGIQSVSKGLCHPSVRYAFGALRHVLAAVHGLYRTCWVYGMSPYFLPGRSFRTSPRFIDRLKEEELVHR